MPVEGAAGKKVEPRKNRVANPAGGIALSGPRGLDHGNVTLRHAPSTAAEVATTRPRTATTSSSSAQAEATVVKSNQVKKKTGGSIKMRESSS